jgi:nicotinamidase-related amidase
MPDTVLLVVGMQNDKLRSARPSLDAALQDVVVSPDLPARVNGCIRAARQRGWKVVFALDLHHPRHASFAATGAHCVLQTWGAEVVRGLDYGFPGSDLVLRGLELDEDSDDAFFVSKAPAGAVRTSLHTHLLDPRGEPRRLLLCGASPDGCIEQTARTAALGGHCRGPPVVVADCSVLRAEGPPEGLLRLPLAECL